jgi:hypothetical protein
MLPPGQSEADIRGYPAAGCLTPFLEPHLGEENGDELVALEAGCCRTLGVLRIAWAISGAASASSARWVAARLVVRGVREPAAGGIGPNTGRPCVAEPVQKAGADRGLVDDLLETPVKGTPTSRRAPPGLTRTVGAGTAGRRQ